MSVEYTWGYRTGPLPHFGNIKSVLSIYTNRITVIFKTYLSPEYYSHKNTFTKGSEEHGLWHKISHTLS